MYTLLSPKFKFCLFLVEQNKFKQHQAGQPTICHADTYEILDGGAIIFYQTGVSNDNKKVKIPVVSYPSGKWEACVLMDDKNQYPVFNGRGNFDFSNSSTNSIPQNIPQHGQKNNNIHLEKESDNLESNNISYDDVSTGLSNEQDDLDNLSSMFSEAQNSSQPNNQNGWSRNSSNSYYNPSQNSNSMPGIAQTSEEFKKAKTDFLEAQIKEYVKTNNNFDIAAFGSFINKNSKTKALKINEVDIVWIASTLIRSKVVLARKFSDPTIQKTLALILPDIMRRQWNGKMGTILQILLEREETKNVNAIDIAVWMAQNGFES